MPSPAISAKFVPELARRACAGSPSETSVRLSSGFRYQPPCVLMSKIGCPGFVNVTAPPRAYGYRSCRMRNVAPAPPGTFQTIV